MEVGKEMLWLKRFLQELGLTKNEYTVYCHNQSAIDLIKNATYHNRTKHIDVHYHWLWEVMKKELMKVKKIYTDESPNMLIKVVTRDKLEFCKELVGMDYKWRVYGESLPLIDLEGRLLGFWGPNSWDYPIKIRNILIWYIYMEAK